MFFSTRSLSYPALISSFVSRVRGGNSTLRSLTLLVDGTQQGLTAEKGVLLWLVLLVLLEDSVKRVLLMRRTKKVFLILRDRTRTPLVASCSHCWKNLDILVTLSKVEKSTSRQR